MIEALVHVVDFGHTRAWWVLALSVGAPLAAALALVAVGWR